MTQSQLPTWPVGIDTCSDCLMQTTTEAVVVTSGQPCRLCSCKSCMGSRLAIRKSLPHSLRIPSPTKLSSFCSARLTLRYVDCSASEEKLRRVVTHSQRLHRFAGKVYFAFTRRHLYCSITLNRAPNCAKPARVFSHSLNRIMSTLSWC